MGFNCDLLLWKDSLDPATYTRLLDVVVEILINQ